MANPASIERAEELASRAQTSVTLRNESDLRHHLWVFFEPWATNVLGLHQSALSHEGTGLSGRYDSRIGRTIVEYKKPKLLRSDSEKHAAAIQALNYVTDPTMAADVVIVTDGEIWGHYRDPSTDIEIGEQGVLSLDLTTAASQPEDHFIWRDSTPENFSRMLSLISTVKTDPVTPANVVNKLGTSRNEVLTLIQALASALAQRTPNDRTDTLFRQWVQLAGVSYGIKRSDDPWPNRKSRDSLLEGSLAKALGDSNYAECLFTLHTYVAFAAKAIGMEILSLGAAKPDHRPTNWISLTESDFTSTIIAMEDGTLSAELRSPDLLAGDFFGWYSHLAGNDSELSSALRNVLKVLDELAWARVANSVRGITSDLLRQFYMAVVPRTLRRALGEFFTPEWLAERTLFRTVELAEKVGKACRVLDPSCGSGTFLVAALRRELAIQDKISPSEPGKATETALSNVIGFDINPVAVLMSRINLLLSLGERIESLNRATPQVYQADSILLPDPLLGQQQTHQQTPVMRLPLTVGEIDVPEALATLDRMRELRQTIEHAVRNHRSLDDWRRRIRPTISGYGIPESDVDPMVEKTTEIFARISELDLEGRNGVWARVIEQAFAPVSVKRAELIVGNPPWINWKHLPEAWQERSESVWKVWGLWATKTRQGGIPLSDIAFLLMARCIATYAEPRATVGLLVPESLLIGDPGNECIRRCELRSEYSPTTGVKYRPIAVDDWTDIRPFSPDAANRPIAIYLRTQDSAEWPIPKRLWRRAAPGDRITSESHWIQVNNQLEFDDVDIAPVEGTNITSPWVTKGGLQLLPKGHHSAHYTWGQGFHTRGADGYFTVEILSNTPQDGKVLVRNVPQVGSNTKGLLPREGLIETKFLWPLARGRDVDRFSIRESGLYAILPHDPADLRRVLTRDELAEIGPGLWDFLEEWIPVLMARSPYGKLQPSEDMPWGILGPTEHLDRNMPLVLSRYMYPTKQPPAAISAPRMDTKLGFPTVCYPNNKSNIYVTRSLDEARFLAGWVNSGSAAGAISRLASSTTISPVMLNRLPIPKFDPNNSTHMEISNLAEEFESEDYGGSEMLDRLVEQSAIQRKQVQQSTKAVASVCEITWGFRNESLMAWCADCEATTLVLELPNQDVDAWAREHWLTDHPRAERVRVVRVMH